MQPKHKYRVSVYLGKENYTLFAKLAEAMGLTIPQIVRLMIDSGFQLMNMKEVIENAVKLSEK